MAEVRDVTGRAMTPYRPDIIQTITKQQATDQVKPEETRDEGYLIGDKSYTNAAKVLQQRTGRYSIVDGLNDGHSSRVDGSR